MEGRISNDRLSNFQKQSCVSGLNVIKLLECIESGCYNGLNCKNKNHLIAALLSPSMLWACMDGLKCNYCFPSWVNQYLPSLSAEYGEEDLDIQTLCAKLNKTNKNP